jgi:hypothetical protein
MEIDGSVTLSHHYLSVVFRKNLEFDYLAIKTPEAFER